MGVTTSFFSATSEQLEAAAPGWVAPQYGGYSEKEVLNPFTRQKTVVKEYELLSEPPDDCPPDEIHKLIKNERLYAWKLPSGELEHLMRLMTNAPDRETAELGRLALLGPEDAEHWVMEIPDAFVKALAGLTHTEMPKLANAWQDKLGATSASASIALLEQLAEVAREAVSTRHRMFSYVSL